MLPSLAGVTALNLRLKCLKLCLKRLETKLVSAKAVSLSCLWLRRFDALSLIPLTKTNCRRVIYPRFLIRNSFVINQINAGINHPPTTKPIHHPHFCITLDTPRNTNNRFDTPRYITRFKDKIGYNTTNKRTNHNSTTGVKLIHRLPRQATNSRFSQ